MENGASVNPDVRLQWRMSKPSGPTDAKQAPKADKIVKKRKASQPPKAKPQEAPPASNPLRAEAGAPVAEAEPPAVEEDPPVAEPPVALAPQHQSLYEPHEYAEHRRNFFLLRKCTGRTQKEIQAMWKDSPACKDMLAGLSHGELKRRRFIK